MTRNITERGGASPLAWPLAVVLLASGVAGTAVAAHLAVRDPALLGLLVPLAVAVSLCDQFALPYWQLDAAHAVTLVTLISCGPLAALLVAAAPEPVRRLTQRNHRPRPIALVGNTTSFAWQALAGWAALRLLPRGSGPTEAWPAYTVACAAMIVVNVAVAYGLVTWLHDRRPLAPAVRITVSMLPLAFLAALIACLYAVVGTPALALFAAVACLPGAIVRFATPVLAPRAADLDRPQAVQRYATAIATELGLSRAQRRALVLAAGSDAPARRTLSPRTLFDDRWNAGRAAFELQIVERHGAAAALTLDACVLEVASAWAALTAAGTRELSHTAALKCLEAERWHYSARVLRAAWKVVDGQPVRARERALAPTPRPLARRIVALGAASWR
jgi:hypothetical protein